MATTYGAPTGLDLSACSVTATGGSNSQTLAALAKAVSDNATAVSTAQSDATDAKTAATTASTNVAALETTVSAIPTAYVAKSQINKASGVLGIRDDGVTQIPSFATGATTMLVIGDNDATDTANLSYNFSNLNASNYCMSDGGTTTLMIGFQRIMPSGDGSADLGKASQAFGNIYSKTAVQVTSDAAQKTVIGSLGDAAYTDGQKLAESLFGLDACLFKLNASIAEKGADKARLHAGFIAQQVESAITAAGLDPEDFALWTKNPVYKTEMVDTGVKDSAGNPIQTVKSVPVLDASGQQTYTQMLRYEQILCVLFEAAKLKIAAQETTLQSLSSRIAALEAKAGA